LVNVANVYFIYAGDGAISGVVARLLKCTTGWAKKVGTQTVTIILSNLNRLKKFLGKFVDKHIRLKLPPPLAYVATLPCETLTSAKQAINNKLQGSVAAYLRCGGVVNNQIKTGLLQSL